MAAVLVLGACGPAALPAPGTTVTGTVVAAPCRPVERPGDPPCPPVPGVTVVIGSARAVTDANGVYRLTVAPGTYAVSVIAGARQVPAQPARLTVPATGPLTVNLTFDSGIR